jgi:hypothetical protein
MKIALAAAALALAATVAHADTSDRFSKGGDYAPFRAAIDQANASGELFRIRGSCASNCTLFLGLRNVCVERSAKLLFHAGHGQGAKANVINAVSTGRMTDAYNSKLRAYVEANHYMEKLTFSTISGARIIDEFGYKECPRR